jgi:LPS export ABC transporter protein LptC
MTKLLRHTYLKKAVLLSCFFVCACENNYNEVKNLSKTKTSVEEATNVESYLSQDAVVKAKLTSPLMLRIQADTPRTEFPRTLRVEFYNDSSKPESHLFARYGRYLQNQGRVLLRDSVVVYNVKGDTMRTNELLWDQNKGSFSTDKPVYIHQPNGNIINSIGMAASQDLDDIKLFKIQPTTFLYVADSTMPH